MNQNKTEIISSIKNWIINESNVDDLNTNSKITDEGILDSIQMISLLLYIEQLRGDVIPEEELQVENFETIEKIYECFF